MPKILAKFQRRHRLRGAKQRWGRFKLAIFDQHQNTLAEIVLSNSSLPSTTALRQLHWLPVKQRIHFKITTLTYRTLQSGSPSYFSSLINLNAPSRLLRSSSHNLLYVPFTTTAIGHKAFSFAAPTVRNSIQLSIRQSPSIGSFKRHLKTHLFTLSG